MPVTSPTYQLADEQWGQFQDSLPRNGEPGGPWKSHRLMIDGLLWALSDGGRWRSLPVRFGPWPSVYDRFRRWTRKGVWDRILLRLRARKRAGGEVALERFCIAGSAIRAHPSAAGASKKRPRPGSPSITPRAAAGAGSARRGTGSATAGGPLAGTRSPGPQHAAPQFEALLEDGIAGPVRPERLAGDKGYSAGWIRDWLKEHGIMPAIPTRKHAARDKKFDERRDRRRDIAERCIGGRKGFRRVATRDEKLATHYLAMVKLAIIFRLLSIEPPDTA